MNSLKTNKKIRLISTEGKQIGILTLKEAMEIAEKNNTGLILISDKVDPPVVKLGDYQKYLYQLKRKQKKEGGAELKEIRISFQEAEGDLKRKAKQIEEFLQEGHQVRIRMILKGRQLLHVDLAEEKIKKFLEMIEIPIKLTSEIKKQGNNLIVNISKK
ncbi:MAG: translation initiation factor IF-3 [Minisyncoccia bacterium]